MTPCGGWPSVNSDGTNESVLSWAAGSKTCPTCQGRWRMRTPPSSWLVNCTSPTPVIEVQQLALQRLLDGYSDRETLRQFVNEQIGMLDDSDKRRSGQLLQTLEVLVACAGNKLEAARRLHIRRQSLYYRLEQIQRLTGCNLDDAQQLLPMAVALTARTMLTTGR